MYKKKRERERESSLKKEEGLMELLLFSFRLSVCLLVDKEKIIIKCRRRSRTHEQAVPFFSSLYVKFYF